MIVVVVISSARPDPPVLTERLLPCVVFVDVLTVSKSPNIIPLSSVIKFVKAATESNIPSKSTCTSGKVVTSGVLSISGLSVSLPRQLKVIDSTGFLNLVAFL